jgi:hypothetical protein
MTNDEQAERDQLARVLDIWLAIVSNELVAQEHLAKPPSLTSLDLPRKLRVAHHWLEKAS